MPFLHIVSIALRGVPGGEALELHFRSFRASYPVLLCLLDGVGPVDLFQSVQQPLRIGRYTETPLFHQLLYDRVAPALAHTIDHLVVGQHCAEPRTPVHHRLTEVGDAVVHQRFLLLLLVHAFPVVGREHQLFALCCMDFECPFFLEVADQFCDGQRFLPCVVIIGIEHPLECPLRPVVIMRIARPYLSVPVEREADLVQLFPVTGYVFLCSDFRVLACLNGILLGRESIGIIPHRVQDVEAFEPLVAGIDVACNVSQRVSDVQSCSRRIGEHIEYVELLLVLVFNNSVGLVLNPLPLPFLLDVSEVVFHSRFLL